MGSSSITSAARTLRRYRCGAGISLVSAIGLFGAALMSSCAQLAGGTPASDDAASSSDRGFGVGGWSGGDTYGSEGFAASSGAGGATASPSNADGSYSYLCGGSSAACTPGTGDCTPGGNPNMNSDAGTGDSVRACQLTAENGQVVAHCTESGTFNDGDPCESAADCGANLGCVATASGAKLCRPYCCGDVEACPPDSYCAPLPMAEAVELQIPVCTPVKRCQLLDDSICTNGQICTIVRNDSTTSCVDPGTGQRDEPCPCASGYVCSKLTNTCLKLCHLGNDAIDCEGGGSCQGGVAGYPEGIGICVGFP